MLLSRQALKAAEDLSEIDCRCVGARGRFASRYKGLGNRRKYLQKKVLVPGTAVHISHLFSETVLLFKTRIRSLFQALLSRILKHQHIGVTWEPGDGRWIRLSVALRISYFQGLIPFADGTGLTVVTGRGGAVKPSSKRNGPAVPFRRQTNPLPTRAPRLKLLFEAEGTGISYKKRVSFFKRCCCCCCCCCRACPITTPRRRYVANKKGNNTNRPVHGCHGSTHTNVRE